MSAAALPDLSREDAALILDALLTDRKRPVPRDVLAAELEHATRWARDTIGDMAMLELVLAGKVSLAVVEGELTFRAIEVAR